MNFRNRLASSLNPRRARTGRHRLKKRAARKLSIVTVIEDILENRCLLAAAPYVVLFEGDGLISVDAVEQEPNGSTYNRTDPIDETQTFEPPDAGEAIGSGASGFYYADISVVYFDDDDEEPLPGEFNDSRTFGYRDLLANTEGGFYHERDGGGSLLETSTEQPASASVYATNRGAAYLNQGDGPVSSTATSEVTTTSRIRIWDQDLPQNGLSVSGTWNLESELFRDANATHTQNVVINYWKASTASDNLSLDSTQTFDLTVGVGDFEESMLTQDFDLTTGSEIEIVITGSIVAGSDTEARNFDVRFSVGDITRDNSEPQSPYVVKLAPVEGAANPTDATTVKFLAEFDTFVTGIDVDDFVVNLTQTANGVVESVSATEGETVEITVTNVTGSGFLGVDFDAYRSNGVANAGGALSTLNYIGEPYAIGDVTKPELIAFTRLGSISQTTNADELTFRAFLSEPVTAADMTAAFVASGTTATVSMVESADNGAGLLWDVTFTGGDLADLNGEVGVDLAVRVPVPQTFASTAAIQIPENGETRGIADPYPSSITVSDAGQVITDVNVTITGFSHSNPGDVLISLVGPTGEFIGIASGPGGDSEVTDLNITFDDDAQLALPDDGLVSGVYQPDNFLTHFFPAPAPQGDIKQTLATFDGIDPNGTWQLFVFDIGSGDTGTIAGGWSLSITTATGEPETLITDAAGNLLPLGEPETDETYSVINSHTLGSLGLGVAVHETATGTGYLMFSPDNVKTRFSEIISSNSDHIVAVQNRGPGQWFYNDDSQWVQFAPMSGDRLLASVDFDADTLTSLDGVAGLFEGIDRGHTSGDLQFFANQWDGQADDGEFQVTGQHFEVTSNAHPIRYSIGDTRVGIAVSDDATGTGFILNSRAPIVERVASIPISNSVYQAAVRYEGGTWQVNDNQGWIDFTPQAGDQLVATVDFDADTIVGLEGATGSVNGIDQGYASGDLTFAANVWNGVSNPGEFTVGGTFFELVSRPATGPVSGTANDDGTSSEMFSLDVDGDGTSTALGDGIGFVRYLAGFSDSTFRYGESERDLFMDIDGDGFARALTDGILIVRYLAGFNGEALIDQAVSPDGTRTDANDISAWLDQYVGRSAGRSAGVKYVAGTPAEDGLFNTSQQMTASSVPQAATELLGVAADAIGFVVAVPRVSNRFEAQVKIPLTFRPLGKDLELDRVFEDLLATGI